MTGPVKSSSKVKAPPPESSEGAARYLSVWKLKVKKIQQAHYRTQNGKLPPTDQLIERIVATYQEKLPSGDNNGSFKLINGIDWDPQDEGHHRYNFVAYHRKHTIETKHTKTLKKLGAKGDFDSKTDGFLYFYYRDVKKNGKSKREILALTTGRTAWEVIINYVDFRYSSKIAKRLLDPDQIRESEFRDLTGPNLKSSSTRRVPQQITEAEYAYRICTKLKSRFKVGASVFALPPFAQKKAAVAVRLTKGSVRICKDLDLTDFPCILKLFSKIDRKKSTFISEPVAPKKEQKAVWIQSKAEEIDNDKFRYLDYTHPVLQKDIVQKLNDCLIQKFWNAFTNDTIVDLTFCHKLVEEYLNAEHFRLFFGGKILTEWTEPESAQRMLEKVRGHVLELSQAKTCEEFADKLKKVRVAFNTYGRWKEDPLPQYLEGMVVYKNQTYFKVGKTWYQITIDYLTLLDKQYYDILKNILIQDGDDEFRLKPWAGETKRGALSAGKLQKGLDLKEKQAAELYKYLKEGRVYYVDAKSGKVFLSELKGEILKQPLILKNRVAIQELLQQQKCTLKALEKKLAIEPEQCKEIWAELTKERAIVHAPKKVKGEEGAESKQVKKDFVLTPAVPVDFSTNFPKLDEKKVVALLSELSLLYFSRMKEGIYNELHLYDKANGGKFFDKTQGYLVGDRICPRQIEIFDVVQYTKTRTFICHNKEGYGQETRDALSQLRNSAHLIDDAVKHPSEGDILNKFWEMATESTQSQKKPKKTEAGETLESADFSLKGKNSKKDEVVVTSEKVIAFFIKQGFVEKKNKRLQFTPAALNYANRKQFKEDAHTALGKLFPVKEGERLYKLFRKCVKSAKTAALDSQLPSSPEYRQRVKAQLEHLTQEGFRNIFTQRDKLVFVYAFQDSASTKRSLSLGDPTLIEFDKTALLTLKDKDAKKKVTADQLMEFLKKQNYADDKGETFVFTSHFLRDVHQKRFVTSLNGWLQDEKIKHITKGQQRKFYSSLRKATDAFGSTIAKFEVVTTYQILQTLHPLCDFKIYEIQRPKSGVKIEVIDAEEKVKPSESDGESVEDAESSDEEHSIPSAKAKKSLLALRNVGNSCYLDSVLEAFYALGEPVKTCLNKVTKGKQRIISQNILNVFSADTKKESVTTLRKNMCESNLHPEFTPKTQYHQLDAASAVELFLDVMGYHFSVNRVFYTEEKEPVANKEETETVLRLSFPGGQKKTTLVDLVDTFFARHTENQSHDFELDDGETISVDSYDEEAKLQSYPEWIVVQLKRFDTLQKDTTIVELPKNGCIDLSSYLEEESEETEDGQYEISGYVVHKGPGIHGGHYVAFVKIEDAFWKCDDQGVYEEIDEAKFYGHRQAYLVFLKKVEA